MLDVIVYRTASPLDRQVGPYDLSDCLRGSNALSPSYPVDFTGMSELLRHAYRLSSPIEAQYVYRLLSLEYQHPSSRREQLITDLLVPSKMAD